MKKNERFLLFLILLGGLVMLAQALTVQQFNDDTTYGNMSFAEVNTTIKYVNLTTAKVKNATITMAGFANLTVNTTFTDINGRLQSYYYAHNGSQYFASSGIGLAHNFYSFNTINSTYTYDQRAEVWNFSGISFSAGDSDYMFAFNGSDLWIYNDSNDLLILTDFPNNPITPVSSHDLGTTSPLKFAFKNGELWWASDGILFKADTADITKVVENYSQSALCRSLIYDGLTFWYGTTGLPINSFNRLDQNNYSITDHIVLATSALTLLWDNKDIYGISNEDIIKYVKRGFPIDLYINVGNDSTVEYTNLTENNKNTSIVNLGASGFDDYISSNCIKNRVTANCSVPIIFNSTAGEWAFSNLNITQNEAPNATNVSITALPITAGTDLKGHCNFSDRDTDTYGGNFSYWYINNTLILEANDTSLLEGGNITDLSNVTFSCRVNDTYEQSDWVNSSIATVGDSTPPTFKANSTNPTSVTEGTVVNYYVSVIDAVGVVAVVKAETENPNQVKINQTMSLYSGIASDGIWTVSFTTSILGVHNITFYAQDGSSNWANTGNILTYSVTVAPTEPPGGGGGGITIFAPTNVTPMLSFGTTSYSFFVLTTPSEHTKYIRFINRGTGTFENAEVTIVGDAGKLITAEVCSIDRTDCRTKNINLQSGESAFLKLKGNIPERTLSGIEGIVRLRETTTGGSVFELPISIDRPLLYNKLAIPIINATGLPDAVAIVISLFLFVGGLALVGFTIKWIVESL